uniref:Phosphatidylinositol-glycan biosynthesis class X protein n=1 Tax=Romanomermis culicivorax TaxID=13658 RepID=A0A915IUG7_ROMCU
MAYFIYIFGLMFAQLLESLEPQETAQTYHISGKVTGGVKNVSVFLDRFPNRHCAIDLELCIDPLCRNMSEQVQTKSPNETASSEDYYETYEFWTQLNVTSQPEYYHLIFCWEGMKRDSVILLPPVDVNNGTKIMVPIKTDQVVDIEMKKSTFPNEEPFHCSFKRRLCKFNSPVEDD